MANRQINFYFIENGVRRDIERELKTGAIPNGVKIRYMSLEGLEHCSEVKNQVIEEYVDANTPRVYIPDEPRFKETEITLTLLFIGRGNDADCRSVYNQFTEEIANKMIGYEDTGRFIRISPLLLRSNEIVEEEVWDKTSKNTPFLIAKYNFRNLSGLVKKIGS